jgi:hypothetical protein
VVVHEQDARGGCGFVALAQQGGQCNATLSGA